MNSEIENVENMISSGFNEFNAIIQHPGMLVGAISGAAIFILSSTEFSRLKSLFLFIASTFAGIVSAPFAAQILSAITPDSVFANESVGALVSSAVVVRVLMMLCNNPSLVLPKIK